MDGGTRAPPEAWGATRRTEPLTANNAPVIQASAQAFVALLMVGAIVAMVAERLPVPFVVMVAVLGCAGGAVLGEGRITLTPQLILFILLPGLLFEAAFRLEWRRLRAGVVPILALATIGVLVTTAVVALLGHLVLGLGLGVAVVFGCVVAPTDPVAVVAVFRRLGMPAQLVTLIEAESLVNDGTAVVLFSIALATATGQPATAPGVLLDLLRLVGGGVGIGVAIGFTLSWVVARIDEPQVEVSATVLCAYGTYLAGDAIHTSPILAVVAAAVIMGNYCRGHGMSRRTQVAVGAVWDYITFMLNAATFLLIGFAVPWQGLIARAGTICLAFAILIAARAVAVYGVLGVLSPFGRHLAYRRQHLLVWGGLRGAVAVALLLSLVNRGPEFDTVRALAYGVVLLSIVVQGATVGPLARRLLPGTGGLPKTPIHAEG